MGAAGQKPGWKENGAGVYAKSKRNNRENTADMEAKRVTVIIPNYNGLSFLGICMDALERQTCRDFGILVVDNGSTDGSVEWLKKQGIPTIFLPENAGFSKAVNIGIRAADTPYVLLLNNDTEAAPDFVGALLTEISRSKKIFAVSGKMVQMYHRKRMDDAGDMYSLMGWAYQRGVGRSSRGYNRPMEVFSACAGAAIYRRSVFDEIGLFDEMHFAYLEDIDVCYRAKIYGYHVRYCPKAVVYHVGSGTSGSKYNAFKVRLAARNNVYLNYKNMPLAQLLVNSPVIAAGAAVKYGFFKRIGFGKEYLEGLVEGLKTARNCRKVAYSPEHTGNYLAIQWELVMGTVLYVYEFFMRQFEKALSAVPADANEKNI